MRKLFATMLMCFGIFLLGGFQSRAAEEDKLIIVIDPGHGGGNYGAHYEGFWEKNITLKVANAMYDRLSMFEGVEVHMTRYEDKGLSLKKRATIARGLEADFVISLHFNASESHMNYGTECWIPFDNYYEESYILASYITDELRGLGLYDRGVKTRVNDEGDNYYGIIRESEKLSMPCVLVEHCHMDHERDIPSYNSDEKLKKMGILDADAVAKCFGLKSEQLGVDYSDMVSDIYVPLSESTRDKTGPSECAITVKQYNKETGEVIVILTAREEESRLLYYTYSIDGGDTYSQYYPLTSESVQFSFRVEEDDPEPILIARAYSLYESYTESNLIDFEYSTFPEVYIPEKTEEIDEEIDTEDVPAMSVVVDDESPKQPSETQKMKTFLLLVSIILFICFFAILTFGIVRAIYKKKLKKKATDKAEEDESQNG